MKLIIHPDIHLPRREKEFDLFGEIHHGSTARFLLIEHQRSFVVCNIGGVNRNWASPMHSGRLEWA